MTTERMDGDRAAFSAGRTSPAPGVHDAAPAEPIRRRYTSPRLRAFGSASDLLEILGPAQANYGLP